MFLQVSTWRRIGREYNFIFYLDANGSKAYDRTVALGFGGSPPATCIVERRVGGDNRSRAGQAAQPQVRWHVIPRSWFPRIHRAVRFHVVAFFTPTPFDRAPDHGQYRWV